MSDFTADRLPAVGRLEHCEGAVCVLRTYRLACNCRCTTCVKTTARVTHASTLPHCGSDRCMTRLLPPEQRPDSYPPYPACSCGCPQCHAVGVACGIRLAGSGSLEVISSLPGVLTAKVHPPAPVYELPDGSRVSASPGLPMMAPIPTDPRSIRLHCESRACKRRYLAPGRACDCSCDACTQLRAAKRQASLVDEQARAEIAQLIPDAEFLEDLPAAAPVEEVGFEDEVAVEDFDDIPTEAPTASDARAAALFDCGNIPDESEFDEAFLEEEVPGLPVAVDDVKAAERAAHPLMVLEGFAPARLATPAEERALAAPEAPTSGRGRTRLTQHVDATGPITSGSGVGLLRSCLFSIREESVRDPNETSEDAAVGTVGHTVLEEHSKAPLSVDREAELEELVPAKRRDAWRMACMHGKRWLDDHKGAFGLPERVGLARRAEVAIAYDPEAGRGLEIGPYIGAACLQLGIERDHRAYRHPAVWAVIRESAFLGPLSIPATVDLVRTVEGKVLVYDWCFGSTDKRDQLTLACLAFADIHSVDEIEGIALYVDEDGVREVPYVFDGPALDRASSELLALLQVDGAPPLPGPHCLKEYCPARSQCPITQEAALSVVAPERLEAPLPFPISTTITSREHLSWLLPRWQLLGDLVEQLEPAMKTAADKYGGADTGPSPKTGQPQIWTGVPTKGATRLSQPHALNLLKVKGATDEELGGCYVTSPETKRYRVVNAPKKLPAKTG